MPEREPTGRTTSGSSDPPLSDDLPPLLAEALRDRYAIEDVLGYGATAVVYLAHDRKLERPVAMKVLRREVAATLGPDRFLFEIKTTARLRHPHILGLIDSGEAAGQLFYIMPYVEGQSLRERLIRRGPLEVEEAVRLGAEIAGAVAFAHERGVIHRDLKPENILLDTGHAVVADFGLARALRLAAGSELTGIGLAVGTPHYMSPEQCAGGAVDGRSDVYAIGCVLYEMLTGEPPFTGSDLNEVMAHQSASPIPSVRVHRPDVPPVIDAVIERALAKEPADRFPDAEALRRALAVSPVRTLSGARPVRTRWGRAAMILGLVGLSVLAWRVRAGTAIALDPGLVAVLPFVHRDSAASALLGGDQCELLVRGALGRWDDIRLVDPLRMADRLTRRGRRVHTLDAAFEIAREVGAGRLIWGQIWQFRDSVHVRAVLYDVSHPSRLLHDHTVALAGDLTGLSERFDELADSVVVGAAQTGAARAGAMGTRSFPAWRAYDEAHQLLNAWQLRRAHRAFERVVAIDTGYAAAHFWAAQTAAWAGEPAAAWRVHADYAWRNQARLPAADRLHAGALAAMGTGDYRAACATYRQVLARDSTDVRGWLGLGDCLTQDRVVVSDSSSPSGRRFRASYREAFAAYRRVLISVPALNLALLDSSFTRLPLPLRPTDFRWGYALEPDTVMYAAFPSLLDDTLAFVPHPFSDVMSDPVLRGGREIDAVERARTVLREITGTWIREYPAEPRAYEHHALVLEGVGDLLGRDPATAALPAVQRARRLNRDSRAAVRLAGLEVRLRIKSSDFRGARLLADSLLAEGRQPDATTARELIGIAVLTGRIHEAARLVSLAGTAPLHDRNGRLLTLNPPVVRAVRRMTVYAAAGHHPDSVVALSTRIDALLRNTVEASRREAAARALLEGTAVLTYDALGVGPWHESGGRDPLLAVQAALARGDSTAATAVIERLDSLAAGLPAHDLAILATYHLARLDLALGDTLRARTHLDRSLTTLDLLGRNSFSGAANVASLVRTFALRALLPPLDEADRARQQVWARAVLTLWSNADPALRPLLDSLETVARS